MNGRLNRWFNRLCFAAFTESEEKIRESRPDWFIPSGKKERAPETPKSTGGKSTKSTGKTTNGKSTGEMTGEKDPTDQVTEAVKGLAINLNPATPAEKQGAEREG